MIYVDEPKEEVLRGLGKSGLKAVAFEELYDIGKSSDKKNAFTFPSADDTAVIMYTSGTTGAPKVRILCVQLRWNNNLVGSHDDSQEFDQLCFVLRDDHRR